MKPRIGLIADTVTIDELSLVIDQTRFRVMDAGFAPSQIDAALFVPGGARASRQLDIFLNELADTDKSPLLAALCPKAVNPGKIDPLVPVPSLSVFLQLARLRKRENLILAEAKLRQETLQVMQIHHAPARPVTNANDRVLFMGLPSSFYLRCTHDMQAAGKHIDTVLTERTAFESLKTVKPDAFVFTFDAQTVPFELLDHIHGRPDLKDMPVIAIATDTEALPDLGDRVSALISIGPDDTENLLQVLSVLKRQTVSMPLQSPPNDPSLVDTASGVFTRSFSETHLKAQLRQATAFEEDLTAAILAPFDLQTGNAISPQHFARFGRAIKATLRQEDFLARLDWSHFLISLPGCGQNAAETSMRRLISLLETTALDRNTSGMSFRYQLKTARPSQHPDAFWQSIEASLQGPISNQAAVA